MEQSRYLFSNEPAQPSSEEGGGLPQTGVPSVLRWSPIPEGEFSDWVAWLHERVSSRRSRSKTKPRHVPAKKTLDDKRATKAAYMRRYRDRLSKKKAALKAAIMSSDWVPGRAGKARRRRPFRGGRRRS